MADFDQVCSGAPIELREPGLVSSDRHHVEVVQVFGLARPQRFERLGCFRVAFLEEIAEPQQVARLGGFRLIAHNRLEGLNSVPIIGLPVIDQPDIQPDAGHLRRQPLGGAQLRQGSVPLLPAHVHDGQIAVRAHVVLLGRGARDAPRSADPAFFSLLGFKIPSEITPFSFSDATLSTSNRGAWPYSCRAGRPRRLGFASKAASEKVPRAGDRVLDLEYYSLLRTE